MTDAIRQNLSDEYLTHHDETLMYLGKIAVLLFPIHNTVFVQLVGLGYVWS